MSLPPAIPITLHPFILAICPTILPTAPAAAETKTSSGLYIPDTAKEKPQEGEVVAVGPGSKSEEGKVSPMDVKVGDIVLFGKWSGTEVKIDGKEYSIMKESDIMGISKSKK